jgi:hypothetical protein
MRARIRTRPRARKALQAPARNWCSPRRPFMRSTSFVKRLRRCGGPFRGVVVLLCARHGRKGDVRKSTINAYRPFPNTTRHLAGRGFGWRHEKGNGPKGGC